MEKMFVYVSCFVIFLIFSNKPADGVPEFKISFENDTFLRDGEPFRYVSGSFHYSRVHPYYWQDRLRKMRAAGLNAVQTYVPWNVHEIAPGKFKWDGFSNLEQFLSLANEEGLVVLLRLGPYICGEWEFGGFPAWLLTIDPNMVVRTSDPAYMKWVTLWFQELLPKIKPFLFRNGGPVVMTQIENEYGSYFACDKYYMLSLRDMLLEALGTDTVIYTTDGDGAGFLKCGAVPNVYATVDFGVTYNASHSFAAQRAYEPQGPLVNSEFYTGWLDHWGHPHSKRSGVDISKSLDILLAYNRSNINMYMFVGGTNFGYYNGANQPPYMPVPTSYDYDAPVTEAGDIVPKFLAIRDVVSKYLPLPKSPIPSNTTKMNYGSLPMTFMCTVQDALKVLTPEGPVKSTYPVNMEKIKFYEGFIMYRHVLKTTYKNATVLYTRETRDRAVVMVNGVPLGILNRKANTTVNITGSVGQYLDILVENQGRVGFSTDMNFNTKGLITNVTLGGEILTDWLIYPLNTNNINESFAAWQKLRRFKPTQKPVTSPDGQLMTPSFYMGDLVRTPSSTQDFEDTYLDPRPFGKGQAFVNGFNLGRYWPTRGPQVRLYVPKPVFLPRPTANRLFLFELESSPCFKQMPSPSACQVSLVDTPYLDGPNGPDNYSLTKNKNDGKQRHVSKEIIWDETLRKFH